VPIDPLDDGTGEPRDPAAFAAAIAQRVNALIADPPRAMSMGRAGRARAVRDFAWPAIAARTVEVYEAVA